MLAGERRDLLRELEGVLLRSVEGLLGFRVHRLRLPHCGSEGDDVVVKLVDAPLARQHALGVADLRAEGELAVRPDHGALGGGEASPGLIGGRGGERRVDAVDHVHVAEKRIHCRAQLRVALELVREPRPGLGRAGDTRAHALDRDEGYLALGVRREFGGDTGGRARVLDEQTEQVGAEKPLDERLVVLGRTHDLGDGADDAGELSLAGKCPGERRRRALECAVDLFEPA